MPAWIPSEAAEARAAAQQTANALGVLHLYTDALDPDGTTTLADFTAAEATFDDYAPITVTAWYNPIAVAPDGFMISMPSQQFQQGATTPVVTNMIRGAYYVSAGGDILYATRFDADIPVDQAYAGVPVQLVDVFLGGFGA